MPNNDYYQSVFTGKQIDNAIGKIVNGEIDRAVTRAEDSAQSANASKNSAAQSAAAAAQSQINAKNSEDLSEDSADSAESWAVGGTGTRPGENTNNAKYWASVAMGAAGGGVTTFNGRSGAVVPKAGDYTPEMVGAAPASALANLAFALDPVDKGLNIIVTL